MMMGRRRRSGRPWWLLATGPVIVVVAGISSSHHHTAQGFIIPPQPQPPRRQSRGVPPPTSTIATCLGGGRTYQPMTSYRQSTIRELRAGPSFTDDPGEELSFEYLRGLSDRARILNNNAVEFLMGHWVESLNCFSITPDIEEQGRISVTSTALAVHSILENFELWVGVAGYDANVRVNLDKVRDTLVMAPWSFQSFQTVMLMMALCMLKDPPMNLPKVRSGLDTILQLAPDRSTGPLQQYSAYLQYWAAHSIWRFMADPKIMSQLEIGKIGEMQRALLATQAVASDEICRQLAYHTAKDHKNFDVMKLAYSLAAYHEISTQATPYITNGGKASFPTELSMNLISEGLNVLFSRMLEDGLWPKGEPIHRIPQKLPARDIGNAYVFTLDTLGTLLGVFDSHPELFMPHVRKLERSLKWAEEHALKEVVQGFKGTKVLKGWRSNHLGPEEVPGPLPWCTAQTLTALHRLRKLVTRLLTKRILFELGGFEVGALNPAPWNRLLDSELKIQGERRSLKKTVEENFLEPLLAKRQQSNPLTAKATQRKELRSAVLYGPPGTAKTTIATSIAQSLGYNFITIDTADFLSYGLQNIANRMSYIFERLKMLEETVILFDEIEEFCLSREDKSLSMESRMLTTAMLTQLNDLRRQQKSVFFIATNRLRSFDAAVIRPGRFDAILFVGTPNLEARFTNLREQLANKLPEQKAEEVMTMVRPFLTERWESSLQFLNFAENEAFLASVVDSAMMDTLDMERLEHLLDRHSSVVTIRGPVRDEYLESLELSRL